MREDIDCFEDIHAKIAASNTDKSIFFTYEIFTTNGVVLKLNDELNLIRGEFNDSAENVIILAGIFQDNIITKETDLTGAKIRIYSEFVEEKIELVNYCITEFEKNDLDFIIKCEPQTTKYNQSILLLYSKTCRANFGDNKCMVNIELYKKLYQIKESTNKLITLENSNFNNGYYNQGLAWFKNEFGKVITFRILSSYNNQIELENPLLESLLESKSIILSPACDKKFITCCNKFNNEVNFRGEPTIAEHNILKNNVG